MASIRREIHTLARPEDAWDALRDIGALHTRLVPGFVVDTRLEGGDRIVTFGTGMVVREPIIDVSDEWRRVAWSAIADGLSHYNASAQVMPHAGGGATIVWIADVLPHQAATWVEPMMAQGMEAMKATLDRLG